MGVLMYNDSRYCYLLDIKESNLNDNINPNDPIEFISGHEIPFESPVTNYLKKSLFSIGFKAAPEKQYSFYSTDYKLKSIRYRHSYVRISHLSPVVPKVDIYLDGKLIYYRLSYKKQIDYVPVKPGRHRVLIYISGRENYPLLQKTFYIPKRSIVNLIFYGSYDNLDIMLIADKTIIPPGRAKVKFINLLPGVPVYDLLKDKILWQKDAD